MSLTQEIREYALNVGYSAVGFTSVHGFAGYSEEVAARGERYSFFPVAQKAQTLAQDAPGAQSVIVLAWDYAQNAFPESLVGKVGRIYQARCYAPPKHYQAAARLRLVQSFLEEKGCTLYPKVFVPERWAAAKAGITDYGKNNLAYAEGHGSFIVLQSLVVDAVLDVTDEDPHTSRCPAGCTACMKACPTAALYAPYRLEPKRCLAFNSFMTDAKRGGGITDDIPIEIRDKMGEVVHGCDICQQVCPRNKHRLQQALVPDVFLQELAEGFSLVGMLHCEDEFYHTRVRPIMYNYLKEKRFFQRNAAVALGNTRDEAYLPELAKELDNEEEVVRGHVAWAMGHIGGAKAADALQARLKSEESPKVREELELALLAAQS